MIIDAQPTEADILGEVIGPDEPSLPVEVARCIVGLRFNDVATARINELLDKNRRDTITPTERDELSKFLRVGQFLNLLQAKALASLQCAGK